MLSLRQEVGGEKVKGGGIWGCKNKQILSVFAKNAVLRDFGAKN